ncbi:MAG: deoxyribodipyrimidine photo-lyase [Pseudomonadota bacterium]
MSSPVILWFRQDLRLHDLPALHAAAQAGDVLPVFVLDDDAAGAWTPGGASRWWLHHSLAELAASIREAGGELSLRRGDTATALLALCDSVGATQVFCSRRYEPWAAAQESAVNERLAAAGIGIKRYGGALLHEPGSVLTKGGDPFKVFTPFWRACRREPIGAPKEMPTVRWAASRPRSESLDDWELLPHSPNWAEGWETLWAPGEAGASARLNQFLEESVQTYADQRDLPAIDATSRLSPHLHHGELSPRQIWAVCEQYKDAYPEASASVGKFQAELGWREFSYHLLHFFPTIPEDPFKANFAGFPWSTNHEHLERWRRGMTGYPIVDAGMRELWHTGYMHNRVRMVVASFLCKHLLIHWLEGERWFWDTLLDADLASNGCSWQWVAGSGADAAPYFRIFNPITQGEKFDKSGGYVRRWVPEIADLPNKYLHSPWETPADILEHTGIVLGEHYPKPIVDHRSARQAALDAYEVVKISNTAAA